MCSFAVLCVVDNINLTSCVYGSWLEVAKQTLYCSEPHGVLCSSSLAFNHFDYLLVVWKKKSGEVHALIHYQLQSVFRCCIFLYMNCLLLSVLLGIVINLQPSKTLCTGSLLSLSVSWGDSTALTEGSIICMP